MSSLPNVLKREKGIFSGIVGKKHVGPKRSFKFNVEHTEEQESILQTGRNITHIKLLVREFLKKCKKKNKVRLFGFPRLQYKKNNCVFI
jgi:N-sulfoglucosamine sulfohydrolase